MNIPRRCQQVVSIEKHFFLQGFVDTGQFPLFYIMVDRCILYNRQLITGDVIWFQFKHSFKVEQLVPEILTW